MQILTRRQSVMSSARRVKLELWQAQTCYNYEHFTLNKTVTIMALNAVSAARGSARQYVTTLLTLDNVKSGLFYYVLLVQAIKVKRHLRARGISASLKELYTWISQVR